jgi:hypothetical protein
MTRQQILDLYFMENRAKLIDLGAFLDRMERADGAEDFRMKAFRVALSELSKGHPHKAEAVLLTFSDPTTEPIPAATTKAASGAWPGAN